MARKRIIESANDIIIDNGVTHRGGDLAIDSDIFQSLSTGFGTYIDRSLWVLPNRRRNATAIIDIEALEVLHENRNVAANIVELLPNSMGLKLPEFSCEDTKLTETINLQIKVLIPLFVDATKKARLTGGSMILMSGSGNPEEEISSYPYAFSAVVEGGHSPRSKAMIKEIDKTDIFSSNYGKPLLYGIKGNPNLKIHHSRVLKFDGAKPITDHQYYVYKYWGMPVLDRCKAQINTLEILRKTTGNTLDQFSRLIVEIENLYDLRRTAKGKADLESAAQEVNFNWNVLRALLVKTGDKVYTLDIDFSKLVQMIPFVLQDLASTCDIPYSLLYNMGSSSGLSSGLDSGSNSVDQTDERQWSNIVRTAQTVQWQPHLDRIITLYMTHQLGSIIPYELEFPPLLQLSEAEEATIKLQESERVKNLIESNVIAPNEVREAMNKGIPLESTIDLKATPDNNPVTNSASDPNAIRNPNATDNAISQRSDLPSQSGLSNDNANHKLETNQATDAIAIDDSARHKRLVQWQGYTLGIQYQPFDMRFGSVLPVGYGGIERTTSEDGMNCDVYVGMHLESPKLFRFTLAPDNQDAEYKWCIGFTDLTQCKAIIQSFIPQQITSDFREFNPAILTQYERATVQTEEV